MGLLQRLFSTDGFMPHGMCYEWNPIVIWLHVLSDALITLAYYSIPVTLVYFVRKRTDLAFDWIFVCFAIFIVACGTTHLMEIVNIWHPTYWLSGIIKAVTALTSVATAILLVRLLPQALALPSPSQLKKSNEALQKEIEERTKASERIARLNQELLIQTTNLEETNKELETFSYTVSHDLRSPLLHIHGYMELLADKASALGEDGSLYMRKILLAAKRMTTLIDDLLAFSRMSKSALHQRLTDTAAQVARAREDLTPEMKKRVIEWHVDSLPTIWADHNLLLQVWLNLLGNAIKYTKNRDVAVIAVDCKESENEYQFSVKDNGAGFDMKYASQLFGVFPRLHRSDEFDGNGIGLATVQRIINRHGGKIWAESEENVGTTFYFTLPRRMSDG